MKEVSRVVLPPQLPQYDLELDPSLSFSRRVGRQPTLYSFIKSKSCSSVFLPLGFPSVSFLLLDLESLQSGHAISISRALPCSLMGILLTLPSFIPHGFGRFRHQVFQWNSLHAGPRKLAWPRPIKASLWGVY